MILAGLEATTSDPAGEYGHATSNYQGGNEYKMVSICASTVKLMAIQIYMLSNKFIFLENGNNHFSSLQLAVFQNGLHNFKPKFDLLVNIFNIFAYKVSITHNLENHDAYTLSISWVKTFLSLITMFILNRTKT